MYISKRKCINIRIFYILVQLPQLQQSNVCIPPKSYGELIGTHIDLFNDFSALVTNKFSLSTHNAQQSDRGNKCPVITFLTFHTA